MPVLRTNQEKAERLKLFFQKFQNQIQSRGRFLLAYNVLQLGEVAEIEAQMFSFAQKFNRRTELEFSTEPAILPNCC